MRLNSIQETGGGTPDSLCKERDACLYHWMAVGCLHGIQAKAIILEKESDNG